MKRRAITVITAVAIAFGIAAGCADASHRATPRDPLITDSGNTRTVVNYAPRWRPGEEWTVATEPVLTLGMVDGPSQFLFDRIRGVTRLSNGVIVVLNSGDGQLRYYAPDGQHLRSVGRNGDGPGEMRGGRWLDRLEYDVVQVTHTGGRLRYGPDGRLVADDRLDWGRIHEVSRKVNHSGSAGFLMESCALPAPLFLGDSVLLCASTFNDIRFMPEQPGIYESTSLVARGDWSLDAVDTLGIFRTGSLIVYRQAGRPMPIFLVPPYGPGGWMRVGGTPARFVFSPADAYRIEVYDLETPMRRLVIERVGGLRPPTELEISSLDRAFPERRPLDDASRFRRLVMANDSLSAIAGVPYVDAVNAVWAPLLEPRGTFDVFDADGIYLGQVVVPKDRFRIHEIGTDYILGVAIDQLGVEYVRMFRLDRHAGR